MSLALACPAARLCTTKAQIEAPGAHCCRLLCRFDKDGDGKLAVLPPVQRPVSFSLSWFPRLQCTQASCNSVHDQSLAALADSWHRGKLCELPSRDRASRTAQRIGPALPAHKHSLHSYCKRALVECSETCSSASLYLFLVLLKKLLTLTQVSRCCWGARKRVSPAYSR